MANNNKIKVARSTTRANLPSMDYGEIAYVKNNELIVGNGDGTDFVVNDWDVLKNKPEVVTSAQVSAQVQQAFPKFTNINPITSDVPSFLRATNAQAIRYDVVVRSVDNAHAELRTVLVIIGANDTISWSSFSSGQVGDTSDFTFSFTVNGNQITMGFDVAGGSWNVSVVPYPVTFANTGAGSYTTFGV